MNNNLGFLGGLRTVFIRKTISQKSFLLSMRKGRPIQTAPTSGQYGPRLLNLPETGTERICLRPADVYKRQVKELISLQRRCSNNLNQVAIHAHTYGCLLYTSRCV